jgi:hypothetical protein
MSEQEGVCPRCTTPHAPAQEYCLECGMRLDAAAAPSAELPPRNRSWIWAALGAFVVAAAGAALAIALSSSTSHPTLTMTTPVATVPPPTASATDPGALPPQPTTSVAVTTVATIPTVPENTSTSTTAKPTLIAWPGKTAYTVVLVSLPAPGGHTAALARAHQALAKGLPQVGVLDSGNFPSLNPGYYVVFSGAYKTLLEAEAGARNARFVGFGSAYPRQIKH